MYLILQYFIYRNIACRLSDFSRFTIMFTVFEKEQGNATQHINLDHADDPETIDASKGVNELCCI